MEVLIAETSLPWFLNLATWWNILQVALGLGFVIFVHELGHFAVAKMCGVKCEKFYVGFDVPIKLGWGKYGIQLPASLWKKTWGETTYGIGLIPLGGYVKMLGQDDNPGRAAEALRLSKEAEEARAKGLPLPEGYDENADYTLDPRSYMAQSVPERMAIISAGVVMNVIFAFFFAVIAFSMGVAYVPSVVGSTIPGAPAWLAGLEPGDEFVEIGNVRRPRFKDLQTQVVLGNIEEGISATIRRYNSDETLNELLKPDPAGTRAIQLPTIGLSPTRSLRLDRDTPTIAGSAAAQATEESLGGARLIAVDDKPVANYVDLQEILVRRAEEPLSMTFALPAASQEGAQREVTFEVAPWEQRWFGLTMTMGPIRAVQRNSPAAVARCETPGVELGLQPGDVLLEINGEPVGDPMTLADRVRTLVDAEIRLLVERSAAEGEPQQLTFVATPRAPRWSPSAFMENSLTEVPALGIAYPVSPTVAAVAAGSPAAQAGIQSGDRLTRVVFIPPTKFASERERKQFRNPKPLALYTPAAGAAPASENWVVFNDSLSYMPADMTFEFTVTREGQETRTVKMQSIVRENYFQAERGFLFREDTAIQQAQGFADALYLGYRETRDALSQVYIFLRRIAGGQVSATALGGPGTIAAVASQQANRSFPEFLIFLTLLSANLAVVNFLPIPVLDGGHMVFLIAEGIMGKPVSEKVVIPLTYLGLFMILGLMIFVIGLDINRFLF